MVFITDVDIYSNPRARNPLQTLIGVARFFDPARL
jgi:hypothetical protein